MKNVKLNVVISLLISLLFLSCNSSVNNNEFKYINSENLLGNQIKIDSFNLKLNITSFKTFTKIINKKITVIDQIFGTVKFFDLNGNVIATYLGKKKAPYIKEIFSFTNFKNNYYIVDNSLIYTYDNNFQLLDSSHIKFKPNILSFDSENPNPNQVMFYQLNYGAMQQYDGLNDFLIIPVEMELPKLNAFNNNEYYKKAYNLGMLSLDNYKVKKVFNNWSSIYGEGKNYPYLTSLTYSINRNRIVINYPADTLIYTLDKQFLPHLKFGICPKGYKTNYRVTKRLSEAFDANAEKRFKNEFNHFNDILTIDDFVCRTYTLIESGSKKKITGLQIYKNHNLTDEFKFAGEVKIIGALDSCLYFSSKIIEGEPNLKIFKIKYK
ncbi:hypothetical protein A5893_15590 [Pedobacter psychrophilus]|uniref:6-bladed beta-propeller n=1 Tax=Pedobacter psychrophilus TaxID=1826909 RepID=A0A179DB46_9SPHI|nr:hypothetical protein [Pedobacter psychrophilus]OAQ38218.1 hypothetical protein A5893_15590 [Pedobacter psychrophilus]